MENRLKISICGVLILLLSILSSCVQQTTNVSEYHVASDLEIRSDNNEYFYDTLNCKYNIKGGNEQTEINKKSGLFSVLTTPKNAFSLSTDFYGVTKDWFVQASVWRKGNNGHLVGRITGNFSYFSSDKPVETDSNGWEKLVLEFHVPPTADYHDLKFYVWNSGKDSVFFDDLKILIDPSQKKPSFNEEAIHIQIDTSEYLKLMDVRKRAFTDGVLQSKDDDWVKSFVFANNKMMKTKMRLKGDWLDHLHGNKWSFRIKLKSGNSWNNMRIFSIQNPMARLGVNEWFLHKVMISEGLLTTRYGFIPVTLNGENLGLYAWEEHFTKQLVESQDRREGPLLRFYEGALWDTRVFSSEGIRYEYELPIFDVATIKPFSTSKTIEDTSLFNQYLIAQKLMYQYKSRAKSASEIFDINSLAKYFAIADVFKARHMIIWHNQRFYYNPVLCKLEPIAYDCFSDIGIEMSKARPIYGFISGDAYKSINDEFLLTRELFNDTSFNEKYLKYLELYSSERYLDSVVDKYNLELKFYDSLITTEFPTQHFFKKEIFDNAKNIRNLLPKFKAHINSLKTENRKWKNTSKDNDVFDSILNNFTAPNLVLCYKQEAKIGSVTYKVNNYFPEDIVILGAGSTNKRITELVVPIPLIDGFSKNTPGTQTFSVESNNLNYLFFTIAGTDETIITEIMRWPEPTNEDTPLQELIIKYPFYDTNILYTVNGDEILFKTGAHTISNPVIIPSGYRVFINEGTTLNFVNNSSFISYSPISLLGTENLPIVITSSDFTCNGFTVLQASGRSIIKNTTFNNLNTLNYNGWILTGAVNFYESDVNISYSKFYNNQCEDALNIIRSDFLVTNSIFDNIYGDAFDSDFSKGSVISTSFTNIGNDAIDFSGSQIVINDVNISNAQDKAISGGENSQLIVSNTTISNVVIGLASKDLSTVEVTNSKISDCDYAIVLFQKKPEYGPSTMLLNNVKIENSKNKFLIEIGSILTINGDIIPGDKKYIASMFY